jgi:hypothetical protein
MVYNKNNNNNNNNSYCFKKLFHRNDFRSASYMSEDITLNSFLLLLLKGFLLVNSSIVLMTNNKKKNPNSNVFIILKCI